MLHAKHIKPKKEMVDRVNFLQNVIEFKIKLIFSLSNAVQNCNVLPSDISITLKNTSHKICFAESPLLITPKSILSILHFMPNCKILGIRLQENLGEMHGTQCSLVYFFIIFQFKHIYNFYPPYVLLYIVALRIYCRKSFEGLKNILWAQTSLSAFRIAQIPHA